MESPVEGRNNNFDLLRLLAALMVFCYHCFPIAGCTSGLSLLGMAGVSTFFVISGYLVTQSWFSLPSPRAFLWKRALRIVPGLAGVALFTILVIGPLNTTLPLAGYFSDVRAWEDLGIVTVFYTPMQLPGAFASNPLPGIVNGSLWTIPLEFRMYLVILAAGALGLLYKKRLVLAAAFASALIYAGMLLPSLLGVPADFLGRIGVAGALSPLVLSAPMSYPTMFLAGSLFYLYRDRIRYRLPVALLAVGACALAYDTSFFKAVFLVAFPYLALYAAFLPVKALHGIGKYGDYSYGIYIYAFPIQQTFAGHLPGITVWQLFAVSLPAIFIMAFLSWHLLEKKALLLKRMDPLDIVKRIPGKKTVSMEAVVRHTAFKK